MTRGLELIMGKDIELIYLIFFSHDESQECVQRGPIICSTLLNTFNSNRLFSKFTALWNLTSFQRLIGVFTVFVMSEQSCGSFLYYLLWMFWEKNLYVVMANLLSKVPRLLLNSIFSFPNVGYSCNNRLVRYLFPYSLPVDSLTRARSFFSGHPRRYTEQKASWKVWPTYYWRPVRALFLGPFPVGKTHKKK